MNKNFMNLMKTSDDHSSGEEGNVKSTGGKRKMSKKESRKETNTLREGYGVGTSKESSYRGNERTRGGNRGYRGGRDKDRQSGTGRQAYGNNNSRRGGYGRGGTGTIKDQIDEASRGEGRVAENNNEEQVMEPPKPEKIVDVDEYMKEKGMSLNMKAEGQVERQDPKMFEDENTVAMSYKKKTVEEKKKKVDQVVLGGTLLNDKWKPQRGKRTKNKKKKATQLTDADFPELS